MALDLLGSMGSGICELIMRLKEQTKHLDRADSLNEVLEGIAEKTLSGAAADEQDLLFWQGPLRAVVEHLLDAGQSDPSLQVSCDYYLTLWGHKLTNSFRTVEDNEDREGMIDFAITAVHVRNLIVDHITPEDGFALESPPGPQARLSSTVIVLNLQLCRAFDHILNRLLRSVDSDQPTIRTKGLKSVMQIIAIDKSLLDKKHLMPFIMNRSTDPSTLVRDAAVDLIGRIIAIRPDLEPQVFNPVLERVAVCILRSQEITTDHSSRILHQPFANVP
jgi:cohesin loading factor subunit SCC2